MFKIAIIPGLLALLALLLLAEAAAAPGALASPPAPPGGGYMWEPGGGSRAGTAWYNQPIRDYREPAPRARASQHLRGLYVARADGAWYPGWPSRCPGGAHHLRQARWPGAFQGAAWRRVGPRNRWFACD